MVTLMLHSKDVKLVRTLPTNTNHQIGELQGVLIEPDLLSRELLSAICNSLIVCPMGNFIGLTKDRLKHCGP